jgi:nucleoside-diphosphate-sugar epimerase
MEKLKVSIIGCGWYGKELAKSLLIEGYDVYGSTRELNKHQDLTALGIQPFLLNPPQTPLKEHLTTDLLILNIPPFEHQLKWFQSWPWDQNVPVIFISSTSVYHASANAQLLNQEEEWIKTHFKRWNILRFGGLLGGNRHPGNSLSGKVGLKGGNSPVNLIHRDDAVGFTRALMEKKIFNEIFDVVSDEHTTKREFYSEYCQRMNLPLPEFDSADQTVGRIIDNEKIKTIYNLKWPRMLGRSL